MQALQNKNTISSLELVEQINIFRKEDGSKKDLRHSDLLKVIRNEFEEEISEGKISFRLITKELELGSTQLKIYELTTSQAKQVLVRESKIVRKAVIARIEKLEQSLSKPKTQIELIIESALALQNHESRLISLENKLSSLEDSKKLALLELNEIERSNEEVPEIGTRLKINQIVRAYAEKTEIDYRDIWRSMYSKMLYTYRFNVNSYKKLHEKETKLDIIERENQLDNLYALVSKELL